MTDILQKLDAIMKAVQCGKTVRDTFGGNIGGGTDVFKEALSYIPEIRAALEGMQKPDWQPISTMPEYEYCWVWNGGGVFRTRKEYLNTMQGVFGAISWCECHTPTPPKGGSDGHN